MSPCAPVRGKAPSHAISTIDAGFRQAQAIALHERHSPYGIWPGNYAGTTILPSGRIGGRFVASCVQNGTAGRVGATRPYWLRGAAWLLPCACLWLTAAPLDAAGFDWEARGILFRVLPPQPGAVPAGVPDGQPEVAGSEEQAGPVEAPGNASGIDAPTVADHSAFASYMFATIHYGDPDTLSLYMPHLRGYVEQARVLVNEVDLEAVWQPEYEAYRRLENGQSLRRMIGEEAFGQLVLQLPDTAPEVLDTLKPWVVMSMLEFPFGGEEKSMDAVLQEWAGAAGLQRVHLENLPDQLAALDCVPARQYAPVLRQRLLSGWSFDLDAERTVGYYRQRDLAAWLDDIDSMHGLTGVALAAEQEARRCLINVRNDRWLPVLERVLGEGGGFVAVGAIHLTGDEGLLAQLSRRGFQVSVEPW